MEEGNRIELLAILSTSRVFKTRLRPARYLPFGTPGGIRTHTLGILSPVPLPNWATGAAYGGTAQSRTEIRRFTAKRATR